ncbi:MAG: hypothetical protein ACU85E_03100 [Gammaproteobacteria bacterium]
MDKASCHAVYGVLDTEGLDCLNKNYKLTRLGEKWNVEKEISETEKIDYGRGELDLSPVREALQQNKSFAVYNWLAALKCFGSKLAETKILRLSDGFRIFADKLLKIETR